MKRLLWLVFYVNVALSTHGQDTLYDTYDLPLFIIDTEAGTDIPDEPKIGAHLRVIDNGSDNPVIYDGLIAIEERGNFSAGLPQKPYAFETRELNGENRNVSLLGMPAENDWVLIANYNDKVMMRNSLSYHLFREMGHYAPRTRHCEVILNGSYDGIYTFTEAIKQDRGRVDIARLDSTDTEGNRLTGGYIFKNDYFKWDGSDNWTGTHMPETVPGSTVRFVYHDPKARDMQSSQLAYLEDYVNGFEDALFSPVFKNTGSGFRAYVDESSFIDYLIISELSRNVDAYKKSKYYFKERDSDGGKIHSGPVWDFDWGYKNVQGGGKDGSGWAHTSHEWMYPTPNGWIERMLKDEVFKNEVAKRYAELRSSLLSEESLFQFIDDEYAILKEAQIRHYQRWPILGINVGTPEGNDPQPLSYEGEVAKFKEWLSVRLGWLDSNMPRVDSTISDPPTDVASLRLFPNPASEYIFVEADLPISNVTIYSPSGALVKALQMHSEPTFSERISLLDLANGLYIMRTQLSNDEIQNSIIYKLAAQ